MNDEVNGKDEEIEVVEENEEMDIEATVVKTNVSRSWGQKANLLILFIFALLSCAAISFSFITNQKLKGTGNEIEALKSIQSQVNDLALAKDSLMRSNQAADRKLDKLEMSQKDFISSLESIGSKEAKTDPDWTLAEIEYLLVIATHRLALEQDVSTALVAMQIADSRLKSITDPSVLEIRRQITSDINALKAVKVVDIPGIAMYLADIAQRSEDLPLKDTLVSEGDPNESQSNSDLSEISFWERISNEIWLELKDLVIISRNAENDTISLLPAQRYYLYQNLRLQLEIAHLAVLRRDTANLKSAIGNISQWMNRYFDTSDEGVINIQDALKKMSTIELKSALPDISSSLKIIRSAQRSQSESSSARETPAS